ncbi:ArsR/SmtB family transcription factor [Terrabacter sp. 2TAF16]|uniref:ArsR/SmtB family transcription factor n=1 Tax=Terrabacter sp. 2TAF16 TaxID=3233008 RepID=UPI003F95F82C
MLTAFHHPTRRWLCELLAVEGPATAGQLARRTGLAVGSVSHHLGTLHRYGFVEPAPELARESWWRSRPGQLSWDTTDNGEGTVARRIASTAEAENFGTTCARSSRGSRRASRHRPRCGTRRWRPRPGQPPLSTRWAS